MQKRTFYLMGLFLILLLGSSIALGADSNFCPDPSAGGKIVLDLPQNEIPVSGKSTLVPRNQVIFEIFTATW